MTCLLMRELSLDLILRVWDTYLAEHGAGDDASTGSDGFAVLHVYTCAALMLKFSAELRVRARPHTRMAYDFSHAHTARTRLAHRLSSFCLSCLSRCALSR